MILITVFSLFSQEKKNLFLVINFHNSLELNEIFFINYLFDDSIATVLQENANVNIFTNAIELETDNIRNIANYVLVKKGIGFFFIYCSKKENNISINLKLYSLQLEKLYEQELEIKHSSSFDSYIENKELTSQVVKYLLEGIDIISQKKYNIFSLNLKQKNLFKHDFPLLNLMLSAVSVKIYFDGRTNSKLFSFFPISLYLTFYPLKYFEIGTFISFDFDDFIFKYKINSSNDYKYFYTSFIFLYGFFAGFSVFFDIYHYSIGVGFYNIYYDLKDQTGWVKPDDYRAYFLPQISFYNKLDIKIFKVLNYSLYVSIKTIPLFINEDNYFYSNPFLFDFIIVEFSILGFSVTF